MTIDPKELFAIALGLSVYISAVRIYGETRHSENKEDGIIIVLLNFVTIPDILMITTSLGALYSYYMGTEVCKFFEYTFILGIVFLVALHLIEWIRNGKRFYKMTNKRMIVKYYIGIK